MSTPSLSKSASTESFDNATLLSEVSSYQPSTGIKLVSKDGSISHAVHAETSDYAALELYRQEFSKRQAKLQSADTGSPQSSCALCLQFIQFLLERKAAPSIVETCFQSFERDVLGSEDIHSLLRDLEKSSVVRKQALRTFYAVRSPESSLCGEESALIRAAQSGKAELLVLFGGQSSENPKCVSRFSDLYSQYPTLLDELTTVADKLLSSLSRVPSTKDYYRHRHIDLKLWLENASRAPDQDTLGTAAFSFPIIGLIGLAHYCITAKILNKTPGDLRRVLRGTSGHSQGIAVAACIARSDSWKSFYENAKLFLELLFWIGFESHLAAPRTSLSAAAIADSLEHDEGRPSSLLSVRGLNRKQLQSIVDQCNAGLTANEEVQIALINDDDNLVVAGPVRSLRGLNLHLRSMKASDDADQSRVPFSQRKPIINHFFLPVSAPFHTPYLKDAASAVKEHMQRRIVSTNELKIPVYHSATGLNICQVSKREVIATIVDAIMVKTVDWPLTLNIADISHIVVFGGGRLVDLAARYKEGQSVRIIAGCELEPSNDLVGSKGELFARDVRDDVLSPQSWTQRYGPRMTESYASPPRLDTKLSRLLGTPPIMVAGMTPTTVHSDVVSAIMNAGYHVELAGGGYLNAGAMEEAIIRVVDAVTPGRGVTCNLIYSSPRAIGWQIPMIRRLIKQGVPIDGITIGAGVPSAEVITEYATTLGLKHIAFKPGSIAAIKQVIEAAKLHPTFPIMLQWTGGRGGGHHSFEDFHAPILRTYGEIRRCPNIILVAGSGFGDAQSIHSYFSGNWAHQFGRPAMPFDGVLLGSRMMVAKEAHTSRAAKDLIVATTGGSDWERSYTAPVGGIVTVKSEMGQPIHKIATRGVKLWAELDKQLFCLSKEKRLAELKRRRQTLIRRLNEDFAKPWFGRNRFGDVIDLDEMTYHEVLQRLVQLMYVKHENRWIDVSYATLVKDFSVRTLERLGEQRPINLDLDSPFALLEAMQNTCPISTTQILHPEDNAFFIARCKAGGQKPVNFIPVLDENFETWFKKDSLWQSEDLDAVIDQDPGRVCILHGPTAAKYSSGSNESAKAILDGIHVSLVDLLRSDENSEYGDSVEMSRKSSESSEVLGWATKPSAWMEAIMNEDYVLQGSKRISNPIRRLMTSWSSGLMKVKYFGSSLQLSYQRGEETQIAAKLHSADGRYISVDLFHSKNEEAKPCALHLVYLYNPEMPGKVTEVTVDRNSRIQSFYQDLWGSKNQTLNANRNIRSTFYGDEIVLDRSLLRDMALAVSTANADLGHSMSTSFPIDICINIAWGVLVQPLISKDIDCDLLKLVHQSNKFEYCSNAASLKVGDIVSSSSRVIAVRIAEGGKSVVVKATVVRSGQAVAHVTSEFLIKGLFTDFENTFEERKEPTMEVRVASEMDEIILKSREWVNIDESYPSLVGKTIIFSITTSVRGKANSSSSTLRVEGDIHEKQSGGQLRRIGYCAFFSDDCAGNPVADFLERRGLASAAGVSLQHPGWSSASTSIDIKIPASNESYARFSSDFNPIHISPLFASWAELPGTITHGMFTSAVSRAVAEHILDDVDRSRFRSYKTRFTGMVLPGDVITVSVEHTAMIEGRLLISIVAANAATGDKVMEGEAEVEQDGTMYIFTGQGSQEQNMGMALYESSAAARSVWDNADKRLRERFGWSILDIVRRNPKSLNIHFRGKRGRQLRKNYLDMTIQRQSANGQTVKVPVLTELTDQSTSYTFSDSRGLLYSTQFAQPAIVLLEKAAFEDMKSRGVVQTDAPFAGHSLGEYGVLSSMAEFMPFESMLDVIFYRGLAMSDAVERDASGQTDFSMMAVSPARVGSFLTEAALRRITETIAQESGKLLEIVNFNIEGEQYVCAGHLHNLAALTSILDDLATSPSAASLFIDAGIDLTSTFTSASADSLLETIQSHIPRTTSPNSSSKKLELKRGKATIPLSGIDVPFHSSHLRDGVPSYRAFLEQHLRPEDVQVDKLVGRWVPNVVGRPFSLDREYVEKVHSITGSSVLKEWLEANKTEEAGPKETQEEVGDGTDKKKVKFEERLEIVE